MNITSPTVMNAQSSLNELNQETSSSDPLPALLNYTSNLVSVVLQFVG